MTAGQNALLRLALLASAAAAATVGNRQLASDSEEDMPEKIFEDTAPWRLALTTILCTSFGALAAGAGIGGGGLLVPTYAFVLGVGPKNAVPLSKSTIFGVALGNFLLIGQERHPDSRVMRPLIDYDLAMFMNASLLLGTVFGVLLNSLLPDIVIIVLFMSLLSYNSYRTIRKGRRLREKEAKAAAAASAPGGAPSAEVGSMVEKEETKAKAEDSDEALEDARGAAMAEAKGRPSDLGELLDAEARLLPPEKFVYFFFTAAFITIYALFKEGVIDGIPECSAGWWVWYMLPIPIFAVIAFFIGRVILAPLHERRVRAGYEYLDTDLKWDLDTLKRFPLISFVAGVAAALLGIGGGMVLGPMMLDLGIMPQVVSATNGFLIILTASGSVVQYLANGRLHLEVAAWFIMCGFFGGQVGSRVLKAVLKRTGRQSYVVLLLGSLIGISAVAMTGVGIVRVVDSVAGGDGLFDVDTSDICG